MEKNKLRQGVRVTFKKNEMSLLNYIEETEEGASAYIKKLIREDMKKSKSLENRDSTIVMTVSEFIEVIKEASAGSEFKVPQISSCNTESEHARKEISTYKKSEDINSYSNSSNIQESSNNNSKENVNSDTEKTENIPALENNHSANENSEDCQHNTISTIKPSNKFSLEDIMS